MSADGGASTPNGRRPEHPPRLLTRLLAACLPRDRRGRSILGDLVEEWHGRPAGLRRATWYLFEVVGLSARYVFVRRRLPGVRAASHLMLDTFRSDLRHAARLFRKRPVFTFAAVAALALGIGANTAIFSVVDAVLLKPLPFPDADRLVLVMQNWPQGKVNTASPAEYEFLRGHDVPLRDLTAFHSKAVSYAGGGAPVQLRSEEVTTGFFRLFGVHMTLGRPFTAQENLPYAGHFVVLGKGMWQERFDADPAIVGKSISLGGEPYTVVGVLNDFSFDDLGGTPDVIVPFQLDPNTDDQGGYVHMAARLEAGVTLAQAREAVRSSTPAYKSRFPNILPAEDYFDVESMGDGLVGRSARTSLYVLLGAVAFVLLIACANVANLLLAQATGRKRELAIRAALGGSRGRIVRQLLTESGLLALAGGTLGCGLGLVGIRTLLAVNTAGLPRVGVHGARVTMDWRVLAFTVGVSLLTALVFGLFPSLSAARADLATTFNGGSVRTGSGRRHNRARSTFVVTEIALALVLLVGSGLLIRTLVALGEVDPGFDAHNVLVLSSSLTGRRFATTASVARAIRDGVRRVEAVPGVEKASATCCVPLGPARVGFHFTIAGRPPTSGQDAPIAAWKTVSPGYFSVFRIKLLQGRTFNDSDDAHGTPVVIVSRALARKYWPDGGALGARLTIGHGLMKQFDAEPERQIVGIVADTRNAHLDAGPFPLLYEPQAQTTDAETSFVSSLTPLSWVVRTRASAPGLEKPVQSALQEATGLPMSDVSSMDQVTETSTSRQRFNMWVMTVFGASALLLAAIGIYGVMAYTVEQRTPEIGIRRALGAGQASVKGMVVWQGMRLVLVGVAVGLAASLALSRLIAAFLYGVQSWDPLVLVSVPLVLAAVALLALWWPARRASRVDPSVAMRAE